MLARLTKSLGLMAALAFLSACSNGGSLNLEPGARKISSKGSPAAHMTDGGKALVSDASGVHGWVSVQSVVSKTITDTSTNNTAVMNKTTNIIQ